MLSGRNAAAVEAQVVIERTKDVTGTKQKELLSVAEMQAKGWPKAKIEAIVSKNQGIPDEDCPELVECYKFWVHTGTKQVDEDKLSQKASMAMQAQADGSFVDGIFGNSLPATHGAGSVPAAQLAQMLAGASPATSAADGVPGHFLVIKHLEK